MRGLVLIALLIAGVVGAAVASPAADVAAHEALYQVDVDLDAEADDDKACTPHAPRPAAAVADRVTGQQLSALPPSHVPPILAPPPNA